MLNASVHICLFASSHHSRTLDCNAVAAFRLEKKEGRREPDRKKKAKLAKDGVPLETANDSCCVSIWHNYTEVYTRNQVDIHMTIRPIRVTAAPKWFGSTRCSSNPKQMHPSIPHAPRVERHNAIVWAQPCAAHWCGGGGGCHDDGIAHRIAAIDSDPCRITRTRTRAVPMKPTETMRCRFESLQPYGE